MLKKFNQQRILQAKIIARRIKWSVQYALDKTISVKAFRIRKFDKIVNRKPVLFTIFLNKNGFTDQLAVFRFFYTLGKGLGLSYCHTHVQSVRSVPLGASGPEPSRDIFDLLGLNQLFQGLHNESCTGNERTVVFDLDAVSFSRRVSDSFETILMEIKSLLGELIEAEGPVMIRFQGSPSVFEHYRHSVGDQTHEPDLLKYLPERDDQWKAGAKTRMLVHIRQGDTSIIDTPWGTSIPVWYANPGRFREFRNRSELVDFENIEPEEYLEFMRALLHEEGEPIFSIRVFSDGYRRAFKMIRESALLSFTDQQQQQLKDLEESIDEKKFGEFSYLGNAEVKVGEEIRSLESLVRSFLECDLVIFGTQAKLIPKLTTLFRRGEQMPVLVILYKEKRPHIDYLGLPEDDERVIFVDLQRNHISETANRIRKLL